ncbi:MAG: TIM barrel protein [Armatimonadia bacterium]|nr:TIM barrel protein [Armatimonadia bacterium]
MKLAYLVRAPDVPDGGSRRGMAGELASCFQALANTGYSGVELAVSDPQEALRSIDDVKALASGCGLTLCAINTDEMALRHQASLGTDDEEELIRAESMMCRAIELAAKYRCCVTLGRIRGKVDPALEPKMVLARAVDRALQPLAQAAREEGCQIVLEPMGLPATNWLTDTTSALSVVIRVNRPTVRILLDSAIVHQVDPPVGEVLDRAGPLVRHVRLREIDGAVPGSGEVDFAEIVHALQQSGYDGWMTVDCVAEDHGEAARQAHEHLAGMIHADAT